MYHHLPLQETGFGLVSTLHSFALKLNGVNAEFAATACDPTATSPIPINVIAVMARTEPCSGFHSNFFIHYSTLEIIVYKIIP